MIGNLGSFMEVLAVRFDSFGEFRVVLYFILYVFYLLLNFF